MCICVMQHLVEMGSSAILCHSALKLRAMAATVIAQVGCAFLWQNMPIVAHLVSCTCAKPRPCITFRHAIEI